ncbi:hypothetical protein V8E36_000512 [Tilletia maclaganii]
MTSISMRCAARVLLLAAVGRQSRSMAAVAMAMAMAARPATPHPHPLQQPHRHQRSFSIHQYQHQHPQAEEEEADDDELLFHQECHRLIQSSTTAQSAEEMLTTLQHITALLIHLPPSSSSSSSLSIQLLQSALTLIQSLIHSGHPAIINSNILPTLITAALASTHQQTNDDALFNTILAFTSALQPVYSSSSSPSSSTTSSGSNFLTSRILPILVTAFGKAGYPHLGEKLVMHLANISTSEPIELGTVMKNIIAFPSSLTPTANSRVKAAATHAYEILRIADKRRQQALASLPASHAFPEITKFKLGKWSAEPAVWASLITSRLSNGHEDGADMWLHLYRSLRHHRICASRADTAPLYYRPEVVDTFLPRASARPYHARINTVPHQQQQRDSTPPKRSKKKTVHKSKLARALQAEPGLIRPTQTLLVRDVFRAMKRDHVPPDLIMHNALIQFEASCERFGSAADLVEQNVRLAARAVWKVLRQWRGGAGGVGEEDEGEGEEIPLSPSAILNILGPDYQGNVLSDFHPSSTSPDITPLIVLKTLGPGFLGSLAQIHIRRSKLLTSSPRFEDSDEDELRERGILGPLFDRERHPFAHALCGQTPGDTVALWLELYGSTSQGGPASSSTQDVEEGDSADGEEDVLSDPDADGDEQSETEATLSNHRTKHPPIRSGIWLRNLIDSLLSAPTFQFPHALLLVEHLQRSSAPSSTSSNQQQEEGEVGDREGGGFGAGVHAIGPSFVADVVGGLLRVGHSHVMRHFAEEQQQQEDSSSPQRHDGSSGARTEEAGSDPQREGAAELHVHEASNESQSVQTFTLDHRRRRQSSTGPDEDAAGSQSSSSSSPSHIHTALRSALHARRLIQLLSSASLAELKYTAASYLELALQPLLHSSSFANEGEMEAKALAMLSDPTQFRQALADVARAMWEQEQQQQQGRGAPGEEQTVENGISLEVQARASWAAELCMDDRAEVGGRARALSYTLLRREGMLEQDEGGGREQDHGGEAVGAGLHPHDDDGPTTSSAAPPSSTTPSWDLQTRAALLRLIMDQTRAEVEAKRGRLRQRLAADLVAMLQPTSTSKEEERGSSGAEMEE